MPDQNGNPTIEEVLAKRVSAIQGDLQPDFPDLVGKVKIQPNNWMDNFLDKALDLRIGGGASTAASTSPITGNISYNPHIVGNLNDFQLGDILAHELTHSRQTLNQPLLKRLYNMYFGPSYPYGQEPDELEAYGVERDRAVKGGREPMPGPNFLSPGMRKGGDIELKPKK